MSRACKLCAYNLGMTYRRTSKYSAERLRAMAEGKARARLDRPEQERPLPLPALRMRITVERMDPGSESVHVFELRKTRRVDQYAVTVDGKLWAVAGLAKVLEGIRKATPRRLSDRATWGE